MIPLMPQGVEHDYVYLVSSGWEYDGQTVHAVYTTEAAARRLARRLTAAEDRFTQVVVTKMPVNTPQTLHGEVQEDVYRAYGTHPFAREEEDGWST